MDLTDSLAPKSDQLNADDLLAGPRTVTVEKVTPGSAEQPVNINLVEFPGRPFRPSKSMRRVLVKAWGPDAAKYVGRRMTIYTDPTVRFGGQEVGGIRVSHVSHIEKRVPTNLTVTRGRRAIWNVDPLPAGPPVITSEQADDIDALIAQASNKADLDGIAAQLKTFELADHRDRLLGLWKTRLAELETEPSL